MAKDFFNMDMAQFIDQRMEWKRFFHFHKGPDVNLEEEIETYRMILRTAADVCEDIETGARDHWHEEVSLVDGQVITPPHINAGYDKLKQAGLICLILRPEYGGYGLPLLLNCCFLEMVSRADPSLMTIVGLQAGVAGDIQKYGSDELRTEYLPRFASGELQGAMDLTEPQAGSDLGGILTKATKIDGRYFIDGSKIFITNGGAEIHLVLAREAETFDQSKGSTNGLSLLLCPVTLPDGRKNNVRVSRVENKLGIHGSPTCSVEFDHAEAYLVGQPGGGFRAMLDLMNQARLGVAAQAIGVAKAAFRQAMQYAGERVQFGQPIMQQPLVKSMLTQMAINIHSARALLFRTCALIDMTEAIRTYLDSERSAGDINRATLQAEIERNGQLIRFFTPLCKYYATEISNDVARKGIQLHGGLGYMAESAAGQYHSDSIITTIYEGTSEIQASFALKEMSKGALFTALESIKTELAEVSAEFSDLVELVGNAVVWINESLPALMGDPQYALLNAKRVCEMIIDVLTSTELLLQAPQSPSKREVARSFIHRRMLAVEMNARRISTGDASRIKRYETILELS